MRIFPLLLMFALIGYLPARAAVTMTLEEQGNNLVLSGSGTLDLTVWSLFETKNAPGFIGANFGSAVVGPPLGSEVSTDVYHSGANFSGPTNFGSTGGDHFPDFSVGDLFGIDGETGRIGVPNGYAGASLSGSSTYLNRSLSSVGITPGVYTWTWGSDATADSITLSVVPEPGSATLLGLAALGLLFRRRA